MTLVIRQNETRHDGEQCAVSGKPLDDFSNRSLICTTEDGKPVHYEVARQHFPQAESIVRHEGTLLPAIPAGVAR